MAATESELPVAESARVSLAVESESPASPVLDADPNAKNLVVEEGVLNVEEPTVTADVEASMPEQEVPKSRWQRMSRTKKIALIMSGGLALTAIVVGATAGVLLSARSSSTSSVAAATSLITTTNGIKPVNASILSTVIAMIQQGLFNLVFLLFPSLKDSLITGVTAPTFAFSFDPANAWTPKLSAPGVVTTIKLPIPLDLTVNTANLDIDILNGATTIGKLSTGWQPVKSDINAKSATGTITADIANAALTIPAAQRSTFSAFLKNVFYATGPFPLPVDILADTKGSDKWGPLEIDDIPYSTDLTLNGFQGLGATPLTITTFEIVGGTASAMLVKITTKITNPSNVDLALNSDVTLALRYGGQVLGDVTLPKLSLNRGDNVLTATGQFKPSGAAAVSAGRTLVTNYLGGVANALTISGTSTSTSLPPLAPALSALSLGASLPGLTENLIRGARLELRDDTPVTLIASSVVDAFNPTSASLTLTYINATFSYGPDVIATVDASLNLNIPPRSVATSDIIPVLINLNEAGFNAIIAAASGGANITIAASTLRFNVGSYPLEASYSQSVIVTLGLNPTQ
ncbi:hypothetical protein M427DRAFT_69658 [Gonapodya prolifera JEL478]|uniref:Uncharacterized protein n=1 Tax=Gonapodya prolifera (strain JEL478) TaxID=1344416 RepID=A0A139AGU9_GONPJ|nr:hypothetical protein M427DRAFT_69658 [Gonapodya prolifera JEL478]|eukprot:KXS15980.1 hypothetical protein M427DRAFT_69658 [Gonapodya prolifera JEL478]